MSPSHQEQRLPPFLQEQALVRVYALYRVAIALVLLAIFATDIGRSGAGTRAPALYLYTVIAYALLNVAWLLHLRHRGYHATPGLVAAVLGCDIPAFLILIQASGGLASGIGLLLAVNCAVGSLLLDRRMGLLLAAVASSGLIAQQLYGYFNGQGSTEEIASAGSHGILLFAAVGGLQYLSELTRNANRRAEQQSRETAYLQRLAQQIIERMHTGVVVLGAGNRIEHANRAALQLLGGHPRAGSAEETALLRARAQWQADPGAPVPVLRLDDANELRLGFSSLERPGGQDTLVFIEDNRKLNQAAQKLKLASLGHLTASIAHEIRNPLAAISHAAELLGETSSAPEERNLTDIILRHSQRVNRIVENVMQLSSRRPASPATHELGYWLEQAITDYRIGAPDDARVELRLPEQPVSARFDGEQLIQVVTNLCNNALQHSRGRGGVAEVRISAFRHPERQSAVVEVVDYGDGVPQGMEDKIFEPFFSGGRGGSGLGLYIARELCEANQATLHYCRSEDGLSSFRVEFAHADRVH